ncbi:MAG TPA: hypothetical protein DDY13_17660 [Cytophagales bacterium]|jgi:hypothetical protein|nr:hypothetical protein [Cytophagales bacterium]
MKLFVFTFCLSLLAWHPFHVSVCDIYFDSRKNELQVAQRIFLDDFENALRKSSGRDIDLVKIYDSDRGQKLITDYLARNFRVKFKGEKTILKYVGAEIEEDVIWCYFTISPVRSMRQIEMKNTILFELFDDQSNLVHFNFNDKTKSFNLNKNEPDCKVDF